MPRRRLKALFRILLSAVVASGLLLATASTSSAAAPSRATITKRANTLMFDTSLSKFISHRSNKKKHTAADKKLDWSTDGCSSPFKKIDAQYKKKFKNACIRHDFGYRNFGYTRTLVPTQQKKAQVDNLFKKEMHAACKSSATCKKVANEFYSAVRSVGNPAFTGGGPKGVGTCQSGYLCLYYGRGYRDFRQSLTKTAKSGVAYFPLYPAAAKNYTSSAWEIYGRATKSSKKVVRLACIPAGKNVSPLASGRFELPQGNSAADKYKQVSVPTQYKKLKSKKC